MLRVQLSFSRRKQTVDDLAILALGRRLGQAAQPSVGIEIRDTRTFDEHFFDVSPSEQLTEGTEVGDRSQDAAGHLRRIAQRDLVTEPGASLIVVDRTLDLDLDLGDLRRGLQPSPLDARDRIAPDDLVGVGTGDHDARSSAGRVAPRRGWSAT
jgi:hypothetical protein